MIVKNRQQMAQLLNERMNRTYTTLSERQELEPDTSLLKTYLLEAHFPESADPSLAKVLVEEAFSQKSFENISGLQKLSINQTEEDTLLYANMRYKREDITIYVDFTNPRYWLLHSMGSSNALDWLINGLVNMYPELDRIWLAADFLEYISSIGSFRGLGLDYDRRIIPDVDFNSPESPVAFLKMQLWASNAGRILQTLRDKKAFPNDTTLSKIRVKFGLDGEFDENFSLDDIKYNGKITARGTSFQSHITLISRIYEKYADHIRKLEENYALGVRQSNRKLFLDGEPINLIFQRPIADMEIFCEKVFSCGEPFRLWGVPIRMAEDYYRVKAVDLHIGSPIQFEIAREFIRVYLPVNSCGNSVIRLYTNLQHHYDSLIQAKDNIGGYIFEF